MKYFEIQQPYYALIAAENEEKALEIYVEKVCDIENDEKFYDDLKEIETEAAKQLFLNAKDEDDDFPTEEDFKNIKNDLLLLDSSLF
jgi:hypothetical protein